LPRHRREAYWSTVQPTDEDNFGSLASMKTGNRISQFIAKLAVLWIALLVLPFAERTLLRAKTYYFLYIVEQASSFGLRREAFHATMTKSG